MVFFRCLLKDFQMVGAYLVTKAAGAAVDHTADLPGSEPESTCRFRIIDLADYLQFEKMIARSQRPALGHAPLFCLG